MNRNNIYWLAPLKLRTEQRSWLLTRAGIMPSLTENGKLRFQYFDIREMNDDTCGINNNKTQTNITPHMTDSQECLQASVAWLTWSLFYSYFGRKFHKVKGEYETHQNGYLNDLMMSNVSDINDGIKWEESLPLTQDLRNMRSGAINYDSSLAADHRSQSRHSSVLTELP